MQASVEENQNPDRSLCYETDISKDFYENVKIDQNDVVLHEENEARNDHEEEEEEEFSFMCGGNENGSPIAAEDIFINGQIKPVYPLFNGRDRDQMEYSVGDSYNGLHGDLPMRPPVKKVFVETIEEEKKLKYEVTSSSPEDDVISGPYCDLSTRKVVEASPEVCKKSNSTGFSRIWRLRDLVGMRSNSDGRDAFVFLNGGAAAAPPCAAEKAVVAEKVEVRKGGGGGNKGGKTASLSAHEVYMRSKAKEEERRRSTYLPYRPELMGFFTNVNGGLSKNVHPY